MNAITSETQASPEGTDDNHFSLIWWVPFEYWASVFYRDENIPDSIREEMLSVLKGYNVIGVVQADISTIGTFNFYSEEQVINSLDISYSASNDQNTPLSLDKNVSPDMQLLMDQIAPVLQNAMGNLGANFHLFVYSDVAENGERLIDPYKKGSLEIHFSDNAQNSLEVQFQTPLNSLYIPRTCPNGENAHISWNFCPWSGTEL